MKIEKNLNQTSKDLIGANLRSNHHTCFFRGKAILLAKVLLFLSSKLKLVNALALASREPRQMLVPAGHLSQCSLSCSSTSFHVDRSDLINRKKEWIDRSVKYYSTLRRKTFQPNLPTFQEKMMTREAVLMYAAWRKIKEKKFRHAEIIYRRSITTSLEDMNTLDCHYDYEKLAVPTLLLGLLKQRVGDIKGTRTTFLNFFRISKAAVDETAAFQCSTSAKVLQAFALFEMKCGSAQKSLFLIEKAVSMDGTLAPVMSWKQFRDVATSKKK